MLCDLFKGMGTGSLLRVLVTVAATGTSFGIQGGEGDFPGPGAMVPEPIMGGRYRLVKNWDFGESIWSVEQLRKEFYTRLVYERGRLDHLRGNGEFQRYRDNHNHRFFVDSLGLTARVNKGLAAGGIESGMIRSRWTGKYGYFECRMKPPAGKGLWSACWLNPQDQKWPPEIDIVEFVDNGRDTTHKSFHGVKDSFGGDRAFTFSLLDRWNGYSAGSDYSHGFHVFAVEWLPGVVRHYVDNLLIAERRFSWKHSNGSDGGMAHVLANLAVGGEWPGPPESERDFPATLAIDYIRVWQQDNVGEVTN